MRASMLLRSAGATTGALLLSLPTAYAWAHPTRVSCGQTITTNVTLERDLVCGHGDALTVGADFLVVDLGGYSLKGPGGYAEDAGAGIRVDGRKGIIVMNGTVDSFRTAVDVSDSEGVRITGLRITKGDRGVSVRHGRQHVIEKNVIEGTGRDAVLLTGSENNLVSQNIVNDNVFGVAVARSTATVVERNIANDNDIFALAAFDESEGTSFVQNKITNTLFDGILIRENTTANVVEKNEIETSDDGIQVWSRSTSLEDNALFANRDLGIEAVDGVMGTSNVAAENGNPLQCTGIICETP